MAADWLGRDLLGGLVSQGADAGNGTGTSGEHPNGGGISGIGGTAGSGAGQQAQQTQESQNKTYARIQEYQYTPPSQKNSILLIIIALIVLLIIL